MKVDTIELEREELDAVTGGVFKKMPLGALPIYDKIGFYMLRQNFGDVAKERMLGPRGGKYPWHRAPSRPGDP